MPSASRIAATRSSCRRLGNARRNGLRSRVARRVTGRAERRRPPSPRVRAPGRPSDRARSRAVGTHAGPAEPVDLRGRRFRSAPVHSVGSGAAISTRRRRPAQQRLGAASSASVRRRCRCCRRGAAPCPNGRSRHAVEDRARATGRAAQLGRDRAAAGTTSTPSVTGRPPRERETWRPGPQPTSSTGPSTRWSSRSSAGDGSAVHRCAASAERLPVGPTEAGGGHPNAARAGFTVDVSALTFLRHRCDCAREFGARGHPGDDPGIFKGVDVAQIGERLRERSIRAEACWLGPPVSTVLIGMPRTRSGSARRSPIAHHPPSTERPRTRRSVGGATCVPRLRDAQASPAACPSRSVGWACRRSRTRSASRSSSPPPPWATTSNPAGSHEPGVPSSATTRRSAGVAPTVVRVSRGRPRQCRRPGAVSRVGRGASSRGRRRVPRRSPRS